MNSLSDGDRALIGRCLHEAAEGPYFDDWEFQTLFGLDREEVRRVSDLWPTAGGDEETLRAVNNSVNNLCGYPHGKENLLLERLGIDSWDELRRLRDRVRATLM